MSDITNNPFSLLSDFGFEGGDKDLKSMWPFKPGQYSIVTGRIYKAEDLGNMILGLFSTQTNYPEFSVRFMGGFAQQYKELSQNGKLVLSYYLGYGGDDP